MTVLATSSMGSVLIFGASMYLSSADNAAFLSFWGVLMGVSSALSPVEQEISRQAAAAATRERKPGPNSVRAFAVSQTVAVTVAALLAVPLVNAQLFGQHRGLTIVAEIGIVAIPALYAMRGMFVGSGKIGRYSTILLAEAGTRLALFTGFIIAGLRGPSWLGFAVAGGSCAWLPFTLCIRESVDNSAPSEPWAALWRRMLGLILGSALTASVLTGYPALVKLVAPRGSEEALSGLFLAVSLIRSPLLLVLSPIQTLAVPTIVRVLQQTEGQRRIKQYAVAGAGGTLIVGLITSTVAFLVGPWMFHLLYRDKFVVSASTMAALGWSGTALAATMLTSTVLVARKQAGRVAAVWAAVAAVTLLLLASTYTIDVRAVLGAVVGPTVGLAVALVMVISGRDPEAGTGPENATVPQST
ncbi:hypothetical protein [Amycolatopsis sp. NPDC004169]|uniref:hypothetical protein n=1 Tax=Amycolatopsis sp. NPDC004169 TaxID=3154453 RepID=UPI0033B1259A